MYLTWHTFEEKPPEGLRLLVYVKMSTSSIIVNYALFYGMWSGSAWELEGAGDDVETAKVALWCHAPAGHTTQEIVDGYAATLPCDEELSRITRQLNVPRVEDPELEDLIRRVTGELETREKAIAKGARDLGITKHEVRALVGRDRDKALRVLTRRWNMPRTRAEQVLEKMTSAGRATT